MSSTITTRRRDWNRASLTIAAIVGLALLAAERGTVATNTDPHLLVDPQGALGRALSIWEPSVGAGAPSTDGALTLWPLGPWFWVGQLLGSPEWLTQRALLGTTLFAAGAGVLFLARTWRWRPAAGLAAAVAFCLSPAVVVPAVAEPAFLFPYAALPWLLALMIRALRTDGWRHPAAFALITTVIGPVDPLALAVVCGVPAAWAIISAVGRREERAGPTITTLAKTTALTVSVNLWWLLASAIRAASGIERSRVGVAPDTAAEASSAIDVLRGLGDWRGLVIDGGAPAVAAAARYDDDLWLLVLSFALPALGVLGLGVSRWRHRPFVVGLLTVGVVIAVGAHPWHDPSPFGALVRAAVRSDLPVPDDDVAGVSAVIALAVALGVGSLIGALGAEKPRRAIVGCGLVAVVSVATLPALWNGGLVPSDGGSWALDDEWLRAAAAHVDEQDDGTRVLEISGSGHDGEYTADATGSLGALVERPHVTTRPAASSSEALADLLASFGQRLRDDMVDPRALPATARLLAAGDLAFVSPGGETDGDVGRRDISLAATAAEAGDLGPPSRFDSDRTDGGSAAVFPVADQIGIVRAHDPGSTILLSGNGAGLVDAASAGLIDGSELIRYSGDLTGDPDFARDHLVGERALIVTDTNRARAHRWTVDGGSEGYTEQVDGGLLEEDLDDRRIELFDDGISTRSHAVHEGIQARATSYGSPGSYRNEHRPFSAVDGDLDTSWRVDGGADAIGERLQLTIPEGVAAARLVIVQAAREPDDPRITEVGIRFDSGEQMAVPLDDRSLQESGQVIETDDEDFEEIEIEILAVSVPGDVSDVDVGVGIAEVDLGVEATEYIRMPDDLLRAGGFRTSRYPLALVQTRERDPSPGTLRRDEESSLARLVDLPTARSYRLSGTVHLSDDPVEANGLTVDPGSSPGTEQQFDTGCRNDLVFVDGIGVPVRVSGDLAAAAEGQSLQLAGCDGEPVRIPGGEHRMTTAPADQTGLDIDQLVWCSGVEGAPCPPGLLAPAADQVAVTGPTIEVVASGGSEISVEVDDAEAGTPFWLVLAQGHDTGWEIIDESIVAERSELVNGYANGFLVTAPAERFELTLRYRPQNPYEIGVLLSTVAVVFTALLAAGGAGPSRPAPIPLQEPLRRIRAFSWEGALPTRRDARMVGIAAGAITAMVVDPIAGIALGLVAGFATRREGWRPLFTVVPAAVLLLGGAQLAARHTQAADGRQLDTAGIHTAVMFALLLLAVDLLIRHLWHRRSDFR